jgi:hypothetical protein
LDTAALVACDVALGERSFRGAAGRASRRQRGERGAAGRGGSGARSCSRRRQQLFADAEKLVAGLKSRRLDFALFDAASETMGFVGAPIGASRLCIVGRSGFARGRTALDILLTERVAAPSARGGLRAAIGALLESVSGLDAALAQSGGAGRLDRSAANFSEVDSLPAIVDVSALPQPAMEGIGASVEWIALDAPLPLWLVWLPGRDLAATAARIAATLAS